MRGIRDGAHHEYARMRFGIGGLKGRGDFQHAMVLQSSRWILIQFEQYKGRLYSRAELPLLFGQE
jgi:hypothetical protein